MKNVLFILAFLFMISCGNPKYTTLASQTYTEDQRKFLIQDIGGAAFIFDTDTVPVSEWKSKYIMYKDGSEIRKTHVIKGDPEYVFVYSTFMTLDSTFYKFTILKEE